MLAESKTMSEESKILILDSKIMMTESKIMATSSCTQRQGDAEPRALLGSPKCVADVDEIADLEHELPHTEAR
jgi:hypothetical protein